ncbi:MAG: D-amino acid dehydrogenase [Gammaproteobacteria bacterium]
MSQDQADVIVLGAGLVGVATAYYLAQHGRRVMVVEQREGAGLGTSYANGGLMTPSMSDPWAAPGLPLKLLKWMGDEQSPFLLRARAIPGLFGWGLEFLRNCAPARWRANARIIYQLSHYSQQTTAALTRATGIAYDRSSKGTLRIFGDALSMQNAQRGAEMVGEFGCRYQAMTPAECIQVEPALAQALGRFSGGIHFPDDESGDAHRFTRALAEYCQGQGVVFRHGVTVQSLAASGGALTGLHTDQGRLSARAYVLALGVMSPMLARPLGIQLPIYPVKGYSATVSVQGWNGAPTVPVVDDGRKMAITRLGDRLRLAGTAEFNGYDTTANPRRGAMLIHSLNELFPGCVQAHSAEHWTGLRPMTPDGIPYLGKTPYANLYLNTGQGHLGYTQACGSGKLVADLITGHHPEIDISGLGLDRHR